METLISASETLVQMHADTKNLITFLLSEEIFRATGFVMFADSYKPQAPVLWLGHDILAKALCKRRDALGDSLVHVTCYRLRLLAQEYKAHWLFGCGSHNEHRLSRC